MSSIHCLIPIYIYIYKRKAFYYFWFDVFKRKKKHLFFLEIKIEQNRRRSRKNMYLFERNMWISTKKKIYCSNYIILRNKIYHIVWSLVVGNSDSSLSHNSFLRVVLFIVKKEVPILWKKKYKKYIIMNWSFCNITFFFYCIL